MPRPSSPAGDCLAFDPMDGEGSIFTADGNDVPLSNLIDGQAEVASVKGLSLFRERQFGQRCF